MRARLRNCAIGSAFGALIACTHPGDESLRPGGAPQGCADAACGEPGRESTGVMHEPAVPAVPAAPSKTDCAQLPTQLERDTCINRKESTV